MLLSIILQLYLFCSVGSTNLPPGWLLKLNYSLITCIFKVENVWLFTSNITQSISRFVKGCISILHNSHKSSKWETFNVHHNFSFVYFYWQTLSCVRAKGCLQRKTKDINFSYPWFPLLCRWDQNSLYKRFARARQC